MTKNKYVIIGVTLLLFMGILFFDGGKLLPISGKIGGWDEVEQKLSKRFSNNEDLKKAAIQMGKALQASVDNPEDAKRIFAELSDAMGCVRGVLEQQGQRKKSSEITSEIEDISTAGFERERRYIRFNANLSGGVYKLSEASTSKCNFKASPINK